MTEKVKMGDLVSDSITGYKGTCIAIMNHINGCRRIGIQGVERDQNNLPVELYWVDETTVSVEKKQVKKTEQAKTGGISGVLRLNDVPNLPKNWGKLR
jgi:hypothetical protein